MCLRDLLRYNLKSVQAMLKEDFQQFWNYDSPTWADKLLDQWCTQTLRSRIAPIKKIAPNQRLPTVCTDEPKIPGPISCRLRRTLLIHFPENMIRIRILVFESLPDVT